jgi:hypothetical protein
MTVKLTLLSLNNLLEERVCDDPFISIGRSQTNTVTIDDPIISRRHLILEYLENDWYIFDQSSSHGTKLDGKILPPEQKSLIKNLQKIEIGNISIIFHYDDKPPLKEQTRIVARKLINDIFNSQDIIKEENLEKKVIIEDKDFKNNASSLVKIATIDKIFLLLILIGGLSLSIYLMNFIKNYY